MALPSLCCMVKRLKMYQQMIDATWNALSIAIGDNQWLISNLESAALRIFEGGFVSTDKISNRLNFLLTLPLQHIATKRSR